MRILGRIRTTVLIGKAGHLNEVDRIQHGRRRCRPCPVAQLVHTVDNLVDSSSYVAAVGVDGEDRGKDHLRQHDDQGLVLASGTAV